MKSPSSRTVYGECRSKGTVVEECGDSAVIVDARPAREERFVEGSMTMGRRPRTQVNKNVGVGCL